MEENITKIKEINKEISEALSFWQEMTNIADADEWAYYLDYTDEDLFNALYIFNHVAQNKAIKAGVFSSENAVERIERFKESIKECWGFDTVELTKKVLGKYHGNTKV